MQWRQTLWRVAIALSLPVSIVQAETVYKCTDEVGKIVYQKDPCSDVEKGEKKDINPNKNLVEGHPVPEPSKDAAPAKPEQQQPETYIRRRRGY